MGYNKGAYIGSDDSPNPNVTPYIEPDKASKTAAIFESAAGLITSASDFYKRVKYNPKPAYGAPNDPNVFYGGGASWIPGDSGEPGKLQVSGIAGFSPIVLGLVVIVLVVVMFRK